MIPVYNSEVLNYYDINNETDIKYKNLVLDELRFIYANKKKILKNYTLIKPYLIVFFNCKINHLLCKWFKKARRL